MPPLNIRVRDHRQFGRKPTVGLHVLKSLEKFRVNPTMQGDLDMDDSGKLSPFVLDCVEIQPLFTCCMLDIIWMNKTIFRS